MESFIGMPGLSSCDTWVLEHVGSVVAACHLSSSMTYETLVPEPEIEPVFPALQGGFLTTGPPGNSQRVCLYNLVQHVLGHLLSRLPRICSEFLSSRVGSFP